MRDAEGYRVPEVCKLVGISYRQLDYWARTDLVTPSVRDAGGPGARRRPLSRKRTAPAPPDALPSDLVEFAHASERQFARLLDFYQIEWQYEPTSFDLERDKDDNVVQRFTPDFYLPAYDLYIEI